MRLRQEDRDQLKQRLNGSDADVLVACNIIEALSNQVRASKGVASKDLHPVKCDIPMDDLDPDHFRMRFTAGVEIFTHLYGIALDQISARVIDIQLLMNEGVIEVLVARVSTTGKSVRDKVRHVQPVLQKRHRVIEIDFEPSHVDQADQQTITALVDDVYQSFSRIPADMICWYEVIGGDGAHVSASPNKPILPLTDELGADESESGIDCGEAMGYSLCFSGLPTMSFAFMHWLQTRYPSVMASLYVWVCAPKTVSAQALFVINIRRSNSPLTDSKRAVQGSLPRGIVVRQPKVKRART